MRWLQSEWLDRIEPHRKSENAFAPLRYAALVATANVQMARSIVAGAAPGVTVHAVASRADLLAVWNRLDIAISIAIGGDLDELTEAELSLICMARWPRAPLAWFSRSSEPLIPPRLPQLWHGQALGGRGLGDGVVRGILEHLERAVAERHRERERASALIRTFALGRSVCAQRYALTLGHRLPPSVAIKLCGHTREQLRDLGRNTLFKKTGVADLEELLTFLEWWMRQG